MGDVTKGDIAYHSRKGMFSLNLFAEAETPFHFRKPEIHSKLSSLESTTSLFEVTVTMSNGTASQDPFPLKNAQRLLGSDDSYTCVVKEVHFPGKVCDFE